MTNGADDPIFDRRMLMQRLNVSTETIRRYIKDKRLPKPDVALSQKTMGWKLSTLRAAGINL